MKRNLSMHNRGITYVEILIIVGLIAILSSASTPFFSNFILKNNTERATEIVVNVLRKAQIYSMNQKNGSDWGVCVSGTNVRLYTGTCGSPNLRENTAIPAGITITGLSSVTFSKLRGEPSSSLNISISSALKTNTVALNAAGGLDIDE